jgi:histidyl-tRNA synthetase
MIEPRTLKGFRDYLPAAMMPRERLMETARRVYRSYGFAPIDTPALELLEILKGQGSEETDKQMYAFQDNGQRWVGMRFDLTVPLARFAAQHAHELGLPFKRYHIAPVWRGENAQRGRYREFVQCDFDTIGTTAIAADVEMVLVIHDLLAALGFDDFSICVNNRQVLSGLLAKIGLDDKTTSVLVAIDKLAKIGPEKVVAELAERAGATASQAAELIAFASLRGTNDELLRQAESLTAGNEIAAQGVARLAEVLAATASAGTPGERVKVDLSIARGLGYYTGIVVESFLGALPDIGSVCSGGRYDNLAGLFTKLPLPGVGASLGLDRLLAAMQELGLVQKVSTPAEVFVPFFMADQLPVYLRLAKTLRTAGLAVELYPEPKKLGQQLKYADHRGHKVAVIVGHDEWAAGVCQVKNLAAGTSRQASIEDVADEVRKELGYRTEI